MSVFSGKIQYNQRSTLWSNMTQWPCRSSSPSHIYAVEFTLVNCPTRWSLSLLFGFLWWSSSWRWQPHIGWCRLLWPLPRTGMAVLTHFFCKRYFLYVSRGHKTFLTGFWGFLPSQKGPKFLASVLNELFSRNWGAPLNFRKLLSTSTDKFQAYSPQRDGFQKLRGAPQFPETALQCTTTDIASTTSINDCFQMSFKQHDFQLPCFLSKMIANQRICSVLQSPWIPKNDLNTC